MVLSVVSINLLSVVSLCTHIESQFKPIIHCVVCKSCVVLVYFLIALGITLWNMQSLQCVIFMSVCLSVCLSYFCPVSYKEAGLLFDVLIPSSVYPRLLYRIPLFRFVLECSLSSQPGCILIVAGSMNTTMLFDLVKWFTS